MPDVHIFPTCNVRLLRAAAMAAFVALGACANFAPETPRDLSLMPRQVRLGVADMVIQPVEATVSREEVTETVRALVAAAPICLAWPGVWLEDPGARRTVFVVRYDLMARDWGADVAEAARQRMEEFVALGFLSRADLTERGVDIVQYTLTYEGRERLQGTPYGGARPSFCGPAERRLIEITDMQWGNFPCGSLSVSFTHVADNWPSWARTEQTRARLSASWPALGTPASGTVTLSRQWFRENQVPAGVRNGALRSICYDGAHERVVGDDLNLQPDAPPPADQAQ